MCPPCPYPLAVYADRMDAAARLAEVWIYPVKSLRGHRVGAASIAETGLVGDRRYSVVDVLQGEPVTARHAPGLRDVTARLDAAGPDVVLDVPGEAPELCGAKAAEALSEYVERQVRLCRADTSRGGYVDAAPVHLVSRAAVAAAAAQAQICDACDVADPRANLVLELPGQDERDWVGREVGIGGAVLRISRTPKHCLGVYADVVSPGRVVEGDAVTPAP
jgi:uncharacterized protein YcbX